MKPSKEKKPAGISDEFIDTVNSAGPDEKKSMLLRLQKDQNEAETFLKENVQILEKSDELNTLKAPCKDAIKVVKNRIKFILEDFKQSGVVL